MSTKNLSVKKQEIVITRTLDASREKAWAAWTNPNEIEQWFGPRGFTTEVDKMEFRDGGEWRYVMKDQQGNEYPAEGFFREISKPDRIVSTDEFGDSEKNDEAAPDGLPEGMVVTTLFEVFGNQTKLTIRIMHQSVEDRKKHEDMGVVDGWNETLDKLQEYLDIS